MSSPNEGVYKYSYQKPFGLVIKSVFRLTRSSVVDKERTVVRKSSKATRTSNTCSDAGGTSKVQTIGTGITKVLLYIGLIGYLMLYKQQNVNYVLFLWNGIMVLTMLVSVVQDLFLEQYYSSTILKWWANTTTPSVPGAPASTAIADTGTTSSSSTGSPRAVVFNNSRKIPCPLEYNILVQVVTGFILYSIALAVLLLLDDTPSTKDTVTSDGSLAHRFVSLATSKVDTLLSGATKNSSTDWSTNFGHGRVLSDDTAASVTIQFVVGYIKKRIEEGLKQMKFSYHNDSEVLLQVISILASYHLFERTWWALFCFPLDDYVGTREGYFRIVQSNVVFPALLILVLLMKSNLYETLIDSLNTNPTTVHVTMSTVLFGWIIYKLVDFAWSWKTLTSKSIYISQSLEPTVIDTTVHLGQQEQESSTTKSVDDDTNCITTLSSDYEVLRGRNERNNNVANIWNIYGNQYDVTDFVKFHPGGTESIMLAANRDDATALFQSYHPFNIKKARAVLEKYRINSLTTSATPAADDGGGTGTKDSETILSTTASDYTNLVQYGHYNDIFYDVLCQRVAECLQEKYHMVPIRDRDASYQRLAFYALIIICNGYSLYKYCQGSIVWSFMSGLFSVLSAGHIGHDGGHFAISRRYPLLNDIGVWGFFLVSNPIIWQHQHTYAHHSFTNDEHRDPDLHHHNGQMLKRPDKEVTKNKNREGKRYHWRNIAKLGFAVFGLSWWLPILFVCDRTFYGITEWSDRRQWHRTGQLLLHWSLYAFIVFCVPFMVHQNSLLAIFQIVLQVYTAGIIFAMSTKVGHIADALLNTNVIAEQRTKRHLIAQQSWAAEQIVTTQDFDPQSYATFYFANGLSLQIEHHLFPSLNHCHLMKIQPIVEKTCNEYNVSYTKRSSWTEAWNDLLEYLDSLVK